jgi:predicted permease
MVRAFEEMWMGRRGGPARLRCLVGAAWDVARLAWTARRTGARDTYDDDGRGGRIMDEFLQDVRYAVRQLARRPGFTAVLVATLALGIGANTAVFSVVDGVVLRPLPYPEPERLTVVWSQFPTMDLMEFPSSWPEFQDYRTQSRSFAEMGAWGRTQRTLTGGDAPERLDMAYFSWTMFPVLGVQPALGRVFGAEEDVAGSDDVVVLSAGLWQRRFGGDPAVLGETLELDGRAVTVLGVMPPGFGFPDADVAAWIPVGIDPANPPGRSNHFANVLGRLATGVTLATASEELGGLVRRWEDDPALEHSYSHDLHPAFLRPLPEQTVGDVRTSLMVMLGAVGLVLLIACANVANLLLVRGEGRLREISIRAAMGAGRARIVRQLLTESVLMAVLGGLVGVLLARAGLVGLLALAPPDLPRAEGIGLSGTVLAFSGGVALLSGLLFGLAPASQMLRMDVQGPLRDEGRGGTAGRTRFRYRQLLVVSQTSLAIMLLIASGLLIQSFWRLRNVDPGFNPSEVLALSLSLPTARYPDDADVTGFYRDLMPRVAAVPGVEAAGMVRRAPLTGSLPPNDIEFETRPRVESEGPPMNADIQVVSAGYFRSMGIPLLQGRLFDVTDDESSEAVALVDDVLARRFFEDPSRAIGERIRQPGENEWARIVGIVGAVRQEALDQDARAQLYLLHAQSPRTWNVQRGMTLVLRAGVDPLNLVSAVRAEVHGIDANLPVYRVTTMDRTVDESTARQRFTMLLQLVFGGVAMALALVGIYGVLSYSVAQRTREIGIRMALGARQESILKLVVGQGMKLVLVAVGVGLLGALAAAQVLASLLYGVSPRDPLTYGVVAVTLVAAALVACWLPARRASSVTPQTALRYD